MTHRSDEHSVTHSTMTIYVVVSEPNENKKNVHNHDTKMKDITTNKTSLRHLILTYANFRKN